MSAWGEPFFSARIEQATNGGVRIGVRKLMEQRALGVDDAGVITREGLEREERRAAACRAVVLEPAAKELGLLPEAHLPDRPERDCALAEVLAAGSLLDLLVDGMAELGELPLVGRPRLPEPRPVRDPKLRDARRGPLAGGPTYSAEGRTRRAVRFCSRM